MCQICGSGHLELMAFGFCCHRKPMSILFKSDAFMALVYHYGQAEQDQYCQQLWSLTLSQHMPRMLKLLQPRTEYITQIDRIGDLGISAFLVCLST